NIGARKLQDFGLGVGFGTQARKEQADSEMRSVLENSLKKTFAPEFLNRVDDVVVFNPLEKEHINKIIDIELSKLYDRLKDLGYQIEMTDKAKDFIVEKGFDKQYGARPLRRAIQKYVEDELAEKIVNSQVEEGDKILLDHLDKEEK